MPPEFCRSGIPFWEIGVKTGKSVRKIVSNQLLKQFIPVQFADQCTGVVMICNISGIFRKNVSYDLVDRIVTFFPKGVIDRSQDLFHFQIGVIIDLELTSTV